MIKENNELTSSDKYLRKSNRIIMLIGIVALVIFLMGMIFVIFGGEEKAKEETDIDLTNSIDPFAVDVTEEVDPILEQEVLVPDAIKVTPSEIILAQVQVGTIAETTVTIMASPGKSIKLEGFNFEELQTQGFEPVVKCNPGEILTADSSCDVVLVWRPSQVMQIQSNMSISWMEEGSALPVVNKALITINASSVDVDYGVCDPEGGVIPEIIAIDTRNELIGKVNELGEVKVSGNVIATVLDDGTVIAENLIVGRTVNLGPAINMQGSVIGSVKEDGTVVDSQGNPIGLVRFDGSVVDAKGAEIGYSMPRGMVLGADNNPIGEIGLNGIVTNASGAEIGNIYPDGSVKSNNNIIGTIVPRGVAVANGCRLLGQIQKDGVLVDDAARALGKVLTNGIVVDKNNNPIGAVVKQGPVIGVKGDFIGTIDNQGKVVDKEGKIIACMSPQGKAVSVEDNTIIGGLIPHTGVVGNSCSRVGFVFPDGRVISASGDVVGKVIASGDVVDANFNKIGVTVSSARHYSVDIPMGLDKNLSGTLISSNYAIGDSCNVVGKVDAYGRIYNATGVEIACLSSNLKFTDPTSGKEVDAALLGNSSIFDMSGNLVGIANREGKLLDNQGKVVGCLNSDLDFTVDDVIQGQAFEKLVGDRVNTAVTDDKGNLLGYVDINGSVVDAMGVAIGRIVQTGIAVGNNGIVMGRVMSKGIAVSPSGRYLGSTDANGKIVDTSGNHFGVVLRDDTVVSKDGKVVGRFFKENSVAISIEGEIIGYINSTGKLIDNQGTEKGTLRADGLIVDSNATIIGGIMPTGYALDVYGNTLGSVMDDGTVVNGNTLVGQVLLNGTVINRSLAVVGQVMQGKRIFIDNKGVVSGTVLSDGAVLNRFFEKIGTANANGVVFDMSKNIIGGAVREGLVIDKAGKVQGYVRSGDVVNFSGAKIGSVLNNSLVLDTSGNIYGSIIPLGTAVDYSGGWMGTIANDGNVIDAKGEVFASVYPDGSLRDVNGAVVGKKLENGFIVNNNGGIVGALMPDASILLPSGSAEGFVLANGAAVSTSFDISGSLIPYGSLAFDNNGKISGIVNYNNTLTGIGSSLVQGSVFSNYMVVNTGTNIASGGIVDKGYVAIDLTGKIIGFVMVDGQIVDISGNNFGFVASGDAVVDKYGKVIGSVVPHGVAISNDGAVMGQVAFDGSVANSRGGGFSFVTPAGKVTDGSRILGSIVAEDVMVSSNGRVMGIVNPDGNVRDYEGIVVGKVLFDGIMTDGNGNYLGGLLPYGLALAETGSIYGYVGRDGYVSMADGRVMARALPDGTVTSVNNKANFAVVPVVSYVVKSGVAVVAKDNKYAGYVFPDGVVMDEYGKISGTTNRYSILSNTSQPLGPVVDIDTAMGQSCRAIGIGSANGNVFDIASGLDLGRILFDYKVVGSNNDTLGGIKVKGSVFDRNCKQMGYIAPDGSVVDMQGRSIGCVSHDRKIVNINGSVIGVSVPDMVIKGKEGKMHKVLNNGQVLDDAGVTIGCLQADDTVLNSVGDVVDVLERTQYFMGQDAEYVQNGAPVDSFIPNEQMSGAQSLAYGTGGSGFVPPSAGDSVSLAALQAAQKSRRSKMGMSSIQPSKSMIKKALGVQDWSGLNVTKNIMSNPVKMNRVILKGKAIPAVLSRSVDSRFGEVPLEAYVDRNIYAEDGREILIPSGSRIIGSLGGQNGSNMVPKLTISWERLVRPDGASFVFNAAATSGDSQGRGGVPGYIDLQLLRKYGMPLLETVLTSAVTYGMAAWDDNSAASYATDTGEPILTSKQQAAQDARDEFRDGMEQIFQDIISDTGNVPNVVFIPSGTRITVFANEDLWVTPSHWEDPELFEEEVKNADVRYDPVTGEEVSVRKTPQLTNTIDVTQGAEYEPAQGANVYQGNAYGSPAIAEPIYVPAGSAQPSYAPSGGVDSGGSPAPRLF